MGNKIDYSLPLLHGDSIFVPKYYNTVEVMGAVNNPGVIQYKKGYSIRDYINNAGQISKDGEASSISIYYANGESKGKRLFFFFPKVRPGSKIVVYQKPDELPVDQTEYLTAVTSNIIQALSLFIMVDRLNQ